MFIVLGNRIQFEGANIREFSRGGYIHDFLTLIDYTEEQSQDYLKYPVFNTDLSVRMFNGEYEKAMIPAFVHIAIGTETIISEGKKVKNRETIFKSDPRAPFSLIITNRRVILFNPNWTASNLWIGTAPLAGMLNLASMLRAHHRKKNTVLTGHIPFSMISEVAIRKDSPGISRLKKFVAPAPGFNIFVEDSSGKYRVEINIDRKVDSEPIGIQMVKDIIIFSGALMYERAKEVLIPEDLPLMKEKIENQNEFANSLKAEPEEGSYVIELNSYFTEPYF